MRTLILIALLLILNFYSHSQELNKEQIQLYANDLLISKGYQVKINKILPVVKDVQIAVLEIPYREYPSIIIFNRDLKTNKWSLVFECLSPGIQDYPSGLLDWHTLGLGVDFIANDDTIVYFSSKVVKSLIESSIKKNTGLIIPYQKFFHMNIADSLNQRNFQPYVIDKTKYSDLANALFKNKYDTYPSNECIMFDSPRITDCKFSFESGRYVIDVTTDNLQSWTYTFDGIDSENKYLINKKISVKKTP